MIENTSQSEEMQAFPIPDGAILLDPTDSLTLRELAILALKKTLIERNLTLPLGPVLDINNPKRLLSFNRFAIQVVTTGMTSDEVSIPLDDWYRVGAAPQILLAAQIDDENNVVYFPGVLTGSEVKELVSTRFNNRQQEISLAVDEFKGGVDRLLSFVRLLEPSAITREGLTNEIEWSWEPVIKRIKTGLSIVAFGAGAIILGPEIFRPKLIGGVAMLSGDLIETSSTTRGEEKDSEVNLRKICMITPIPIKEKNTDQIANISIDKPLIFALDPLNKLTITRNGNKLWGLSGKSEKRIKGPIPWPIEPIEAGEKLLLNITPGGFSYNEKATIILQANPEDSLQKLDNVINSLGNKKSRWIKTINENLETDTNLALTLLFSDKAPKSRWLEKARSVVLNKETCLKSE